MKKLYLPIKIFFEFLLYFGGLLLATIPTIWYYSKVDRVVISPICIEWMLPFYLLLVSVLMDLNYKNPVPIWRIIPCCGIIGVGWYVTRISFEKYYANMGRIPDSLTYFITDSFTQICVWIVAIGLVIYQIIKYIVLESRKNNDKQ